MKLFNLNIKGDLGTGVLQSELDAPNSAFTKAWQNFLRELDSCGVKINAARIDNAGKTIELKTEVHAGV